MIMKTIRLIPLGIGIILSLISCNKTEIDDQKPFIASGTVKNIPENCDTLYFGESFTFSSLFTDNVALGTYSLEIHQNFDHHSHSTDISECTMDPVKTAVNPYQFIMDYSIPEGLTAYTASDIITIPQGNAQGAFDEGDYHFFISLTDKEGWSVQKGMSIKILTR